MNRIDIELLDTSKFKGGWGLSPHEIYLSLKYLDYDKILKILEFGSGDGTTYLTDLLNYKKINFEYKSIENDENYAKTFGVEYQLYKLIDIDDVILETNGFFDLIIVDGPHGVDRYKWYSKFKKNVRIGTIILIDDFHHYNEFNDELNKHYEYELVSLFNQNRMFTENDINDGIEKIDTNSELIMDKSFKIIKISKIKN